MDDLFASKQSSKRVKPIKQKGKGDEDLFGNTDDIFGDIPASKPKAAGTKGKKGKKKAKGAVKKEDNPQTDETPPTEGQ